MNEKKLNGTVRPKKAFKKFTATLQVQLQQRIESLNSRQASREVAENLPTYFNSYQEKHRELLTSIKLMVCIEDPVVIEKILTHLDSKAAGGAARRLPAVSGSAPG